MTLRGASNMSPQERLLAALDRQPCDHVPFSPVLDGYFISSLPPEMKERHEVDVQYELSGHVILRLPVIRLNTALWLWGEFLNPADPPPNVEHKVGLENGQISHSVATPVGALTCRAHFAPESPFIPWITEYRIHTVEDVKTFQWLVEHTDFELTTKSIKRQQEIIGDRGLAVAIAPSSPLAQMICEDIGMETLTYLLADYPDEMNEMLSTFHAKQIEMWKVMVEAPTDIFVIHDNLSSTTTSRAQYRRYDRRYVNDYADIVHAAGKKLYTHWCGRLTALAADFDEARHDGIWEITPLPTGDADIPEARRTWAKHFTLKGGIDPTLFSGGTPAEMEAYVEELLTQMQPDLRGFILGSGDATPYGTPPESVLAAKAVAERFAVD